MQALSRSPPAESTVASSFPTNVSPSPSVSPTSTVFDISENSASLESPGTPCKSSVGRSPSSPPQDVDSQPTTVVISGDCPSQNAPETDSTARVKRPSNAFILFRSYLIRNGFLGKSVEKDKRKVSKIAALVWKRLSETKKAHFHEQAQKARDEHRARYPDYRYPQPGQASVQGRRKPKSKVTFGAQEEDLMASIAALLLEGSTGDSIVQYLAKRGETGTSTTLQPVEVD